MPQSGIESFFALVRFMLAGGFAEFIDLRLWFRHDVPPVHR